MDFKTNLGVTLLLILFGVSFGACSEDLDQPEESSININNVGPDGKEDSGWLGADSFEVNATVVAVVQQEVEGAWEELATDETLQATLVDKQLKFIKTSAESYGWRFNQLAQEVVILSLTVEDGIATIEYQATIDMLGRYRGSLPDLEDIDPNVFSAKVPADPVGFRYADIAACSESDGSHSVSDYNFHYYFAPDKDMCALELNVAEVQITEVFDRPIVYPEYDLLMQDMGDGTVGFRAALVPNRGDEDPSSRFNAHATELEHELGLIGEDQEEGLFRRYIYRVDDVKIIIDLYDPTKLDWTNSFASSFRHRLGEYTLIHYNGHSSYGTKHLLDDPESFTDSYQIIVMHSCQSYAYYTRQVFRAKETAEDPTGFALADVVSTGKSSYPSGAPPVIRVLLESLMEGMTAIASGEREQAVDWNTIVERFESETWGDIMYGVAGVRTNTWQP